MRRGRGSHGLWLAMALLWPIVAAAQVGPAGAVRVTVSRANVRSGPTLDATVVTRVTRDTVLALHGVEGDWFRVRLYVGSLQIEAYISRTVSEPIETAVAAGAGRPEVRDGISVAVRDDTGELGLPPVAAGRLTVPGEAASLRAIADALPPSDLPLTDLALDTPATGVWLVALDQPSLAISSRRPVFVADFSGFDGLDPAGLTAAIVRYAPAVDGRRVIAAVTGRFEQVSRSDPGWDVMDRLMQDTVAASVAATAPGAVRLQPSADLEPGDYGVVIRPAGRDARAGSVTRSDSPDGRLLGLVWSFTIR